MELIPIFALIYYFTQHGASAQLECPAVIRNSTDFILQACLLDLYDKNSAPYSSSTNDTEVELYFDLRYLFLVNDKILMYGDLELFWVDERLSFDTDFYEGRVYVSLPRTKVWKPTLVDKKRAGNSVFNTGYASLIPNSGHNVWVHYSGHVYLDQVITLVGKCDESDYSFYPFDVHNCSAYISAPDPGLNYSIHPFDFHDYSTYYDRIQKLNITQTETPSETLIKLNVVIRRHSRMHIVMLHVPVLAFLFFNFISLWMSHSHLMKHMLPLAAFCGALYQLHAINNLMVHSFSHSDVFAVSGSKPLHIILLYRNVIFLSLMVLLQSFVTSLFGVSRKVLASFLMVYSDTYAKACQPTNAVKVEYSDDPSEEIEDPQSIISPASTVTPLFSTPLSYGDYAMAICDILINAYIAYNFGYLTFLVLHK